MLIYFVFKSCRFCWKKRSNTQNLNLFLLHILRPIWLPQQIIVWIIVEKNLTALLIILHRQKLLKARRNSELKFPGCVRVQLGNGYVGSIAHTGHSFLCSEQTVHFEDNPIRSSTRQSVLRQVHSSSKASSPQSSIQRFVFQFPLSSCFLQGIRQLTYIFFLVFPSAIFFLPSSFQ